MCQVAEWVFGPLNDAGSNPAIDFSLFIFFVRIKYAFFHRFEINIFVAI